MLAALVLNTMSMYDKYFGLSDKPFSIAPDPRYLFMSQQHREALAHLVYGIGEGGGFVLLTGEVGTGKTTVCRCLLEQIPETTKIAFILNPKLSANELLSTVCDELHIEHSQYPTLKELNDKLNHYLLEAHANSRKTVLMIDEAQNLDIEVLEQIRLLTNLETNKEKLLQIILIGQPELKDILCKHELRQLAQRITARYHLRSLTKEECYSYISHRLSVSGFTENLFEDKAIEELYKRTGGVPRLINVLCDRAMLGAYAKNKKIIDVSMIKHAATEIMGGDVIPEQSDGIRSGTGPVKSWKWSSVALAAVLFIAVFFGLSEIQTLKHTIDTMEDIKSKADDYSVELLQDNQKLEKQVEQLLEEKKIRETQLLPFLPADLKPTNLAIAYQQLANHWNIDYQPSLDGDFCDHTSKYNKLCATEVADWSSLNILDRPAILHMNGNNGNTVYGIIEQVDEQQVMVNFEGTSMRLAKEQISSVWSGSITYLWQAPPGYEEPLRLEMQGTPVQWLKVNLAKLDNLDLIVPPDTPYDLDLQFQVLKFQEKYGLETDAVAGPSTLIRLNSLVGNEHPTLAWRGES